MASVKPHRESGRPRLGLRVARALSSVVVISGALGAPATALAVPAITAARPCFVNTTKIAPVTIVGSGWVAGDQIQLSSADGSLFGDVTAAADGSFTATIPGALLHTSGPGVLNETMTATDEGNDTTEALANGNVATTGFQITNLAFSVNPQEARFTKPVTFSFSGFEAGQEIYAHYIHKGHVVAIQKFGRTVGACGVLKKKKALQYPGGHPKFKQYTVQFDDRRRYSAKATPRFVSKLSILTF